MLRFLFILISVTVLNTLTSSGQERDWIYITISGKAYDAGRNSQPLIDLMVINLRTQQGFFGKEDGTFTTNIQRTDTLIIASTGYTSQKLCFKDSSLAMQKFFIEVALE